MFSIYKKEVLSYFNSLTGYLAIALFLIVTGLVVWVFPDTSLLDTGYATLDGFFSISPYLFMFLVPAITMRTIAGEKADGTYDLLLSRPLTIPQITIGKFLGAVTITTLSILPTTIYALSIYYLGNPVGNLDIGATIGSYIGLLLLASSFVAIGLLCSSLTQNPIVSFLLAVFACFIVFYGFGAVSKMMLFASFEDEIRNLGTQEHYWSISRGVLMAKDLIYFLSLTALFLTFTVGHLGRTFRPRKKTFTVYGLTITTIIAVNHPIITDRLDRIDFTEDKRFTLNDTSKELVNDLDSDIYITLFLDGDLPSGFKRLRKAALDMAHDLRSYSQGKIKVNIIDPLEGSEHDRQEFAQRLIERGLYPTNLSVRTDSGLSQKLVFPWAMVGSSENEIAINLLQNKMGATPDEVLNNSIQNLEYALVNAIQKAGNSETPFIGFTEGHGEPTDLELYDAMQTLFTSNQVGRVNLDSVTYESLQQLKVMIVVKPQTTFSESDKYKIDYFVRNGGRVIWAVDQIDASLDHLRETGSQPLVSRDLNLDDMLFLYGVRFNHNIVADLNCTQIPISVGNVGGQAQIELVPWYFHPIIMPVSKHPIVKDLDGIRTEFIGTIDTIENGIDKEILLQSSPFTRLINPPYEISLQMVEEEPDPTKFRTAPAPVAVMLSGHFPYIFENRPSPQGITSPVDLSNISQETKMLVFSDGDWLINQVNQSDQSPYPLGWDRYMNQQFANKVFLENIVDYMLYDEKLITLRNREVKLRLLDQPKIKTEKLAWQLINVAGPVALLIVIGTTQQLWRKRRYTKLK